MTVVEPEPVEGRFDTALVARARDEVSRSVVALIREEPFFGHVLAGVNRDFSDQTTTAGVSFRAGRPLLSVNPEFFVRRITRKDERTAVIKHEVLHLIFDHLNRIDWNRMHRDVFNVAADLVVNQFIGRKWPLPKGAILLDSFDFHLPPDQSVEWYYDELMRHVTVVEGDVSWNEGSGWLGRSDSDSDETDPFGSSHSDHRGWVGDNQAGDTGLGRYELARLLRDARDRSSRSYSTVAEPIRRLVDAHIAELEPTIDWRRVLRMFSNSSRRTRISNTLRRPSKRYGTYPGTKVRRFHRLAVIVDTSASVNVDLLAEFFGEVHGMWRQGSEITVVEADEMVQRVWEYRGEGPPDLIGGRGGTSFDPPLRWVAESARPFDAAIYLTDGHAKPPTVRPRCKVLWVLPDDGSAEALANHRIVRIQR